VVSGLTFGLEDLSETLKIILFSEESWSHGTTYDTQVELFPEWAGHTVTLGPGHELQKPGTKISQIATMVTL
jgi:hypothetical protein